MIAILVFAHLFTFPADALMEETSSSQMINQAKEYDRHEVVYSGEVIGDTLNVGDHVWLNVSDGSNAIGVWVQSDLADLVQVPGRYSQHGDLIQVSGTFYRACPEHGGDMDLHADTITLITRGYPVSHVVLAWKVWLAVLLTIAASALIARVLFRIIRKPSLRYRP